MPFKNYNKSFGGEKGSAAKAHMAMLKTYPSKKEANKVFYATANARKPGGMHEHLMDLKKKGKLLGKRKLAPRVPTLKMKQAML